MALTFKSGVDVPLAVHAETMNSAFKGYLAGDIQLTVPWYAAMLSQDGVDLNMTQLAFDDETPVGIALVAWRGGICRLAAMGVVGGAQEKGIGTQLMAHLIQQAQERGDTQYVLECFEQNERGIKLYERHGFVAQERLYGYDAPDRESSNANVNILYQRVPMLQVAQAMIAHGSPDLPWQIAGYMLSKLSKPFIAIEYEGAYAVISDPESHLAMIRAVVVPPELQNQGHGRGLIQMLLDVYPEKAWRIPQICPEAAGATLFEPLGFTRAELNQFRMVCDL